MQKHGEQKLRELYKEHGNNVEKIAKSIVEIVALDQHPGSNSLQSRENEEVKVA